MSCQPFPITLRQCSSKRGQPLKKNIKVMFLLDFEKKRKKT